MAFSGGPFDVPSGWSPGLCSVGDGSKGGAEADGWEGTWACGGGVSGVRAFLSSACVGAGVLGLTVGSGACGGGVSGVRAFLSSACVELGFWA